MKPTKITFEIRYGDDSGVEKAVSYYEHSSGDEISISHHGGNITFSIADLKWLIESLREIEEIIPIDMEPL